MDIDETYYILMAAVLTSNATNKQRAELEVLLSEHESIRKVYQQLSFIYQHPLPSTQEHFEADTMFQQLSKKLTH